MNESAILCRLQSQTLRYTGIVLQNPHQIDIPKGITVIVGSNGSGKSSLARVLEFGSNFMTNDIRWDVSSDVSLMDDNVASVDKDGFISGSQQRRPRVLTVEFRDIHSLAGNPVEYYQQRYESTMNDDVLTVAQVLGIDAHNDIWRRLSQALDLHGCLDKKINYLSSGELRKLLIIRSLIQAPDLLVLDNPFIGLDASSRIAVSEALATLAEGGISIMLLVSDTYDIPDFCDHVIMMRDFEIDKVLPKRDFDTRLIPTVATTTSPVPLPCHRRHITDSMVPDVRMVDCNISYGERHVLQHIDWTIMPGEAWALSGANGSGKSTLLSLINADNPRAYSNHIELFGKRRGSGESIWEVKSRIGFMSSEQHLYYGFGYDTVGQMLADGCRPAIERYTPLPAEMCDLIRQWVEYFGIEDLMEVKFANLSFGRQRLVMMIRAFLGARDLLILDEPLHGLDPQVKVLALRAIDTLVASGVTLIYVTHNPEEYPSCITHHKELMKM